MKVLRSWQFRVTAGVYGAGLIVGVALPAAQGGAATGSALRPTFVQLLWTVFSTNIAVNALVVVSGILTFGALSMVFVGFNGFLLGSAWRAGVSQASVGAVALATVPHGVPEVLSLVLAGYLALVLASAFLSVFRRDGNASLASLPMHVLRISALIMALTLVAALIEAAVGTWMMPV